MVIKSITKEQKQYISVILDKWENLQTVSNDQLMIESIQKMYASMGLSPNVPVLIFDSPLACEIVAGTFLKEENKENKENKEIERKGYINSWWGVWAAMYEYAKYIGVIFPENEYDLFLSFNTNVGFSIPFENICIASRKPVKIHWKDKQLHHTTEKAVEYADGWGWYAYEGVAMPEKYYENPGQPWDPKWIDEERNADVRAKLLKEIGFERWVQESNADVLDTATINDLPYKLLQKTDPTIGPMKFLHMKNPSVEGTYHLEAVPPDTWIKTCEDALRWRQLGDKAKDKTITIQNLFVK